MRDQCFNKVLAVDPTTRGFAFAIVEAGRVIDRGEKRIVGPCKNRRCEEALEALVRTRRPDVLALEHCTAPGSRRCARVRALMRSFGAVASRHGVSVELVSPRFLREACVGDPRATKHQIAVALAARFPELRHHVPPRRKVWMTEHPRTNVFDAIALAATVIERTSMRR